MLPQDPIILLSVINTKLRDNYSCLKELCDDMGESEQDILLKLSQAGFEYDSERNCFR